MRMLCPWQIARLFPLVPGVRRMLGPELGTDTWTKDRRKDPKQCVPSSCETNPFRSVVWETAPFHCLAYFDYPENECFFYYDLKNRPFFTNDCAAHCQTLKKVPFSYFYSRIGTKSGSKRPPWALGTVRYIKLLMNMWLLLITWYMYI